MRVIRKEIKTKYHYELPNAEVIDRTRMAEALNKAGYKPHTGERSDKSEVSRQLVSLWIRTGKFPDDVIPYIKQIRTMDVVSKGRNRKQLQN